MLTPELLARAAVSESDWWRPGPEFLIDFDLLRGHVADAIRAAVDAERERCAHIAESFIPSGFTGTGKAGNTYAVARDDRARVIAAAIRARSQE